MPNCLTGARAAARLPNVRPLTLALAASLALFAVGNTAEARDLPSIDALADAPLPQRDTTQAASAVQQRLARLGFRGHADQRLQAPTFVWASDPHRLPSPGAVALSEESAARAHLTAMTPLYGLSDGQASGMRMLDRTVLPSGATLIRLNNAVEGVEVFREQVGVLMRADRSLIAVGGSLSPAPEASVAKAAGMPVSARDAVATALADYDFASASTASELQASGQRDGYQFFGLPPSATSASGARLTQPARVKPVYFRLAEGLVPAFYVEIQAADSAEAAADYYAYVVSAKNGEVLFRHNQTSHANFNYRVWADSSGTRRPLPGPQGDSFTPHPTGVPDGSQPPFIAPNLISLQNGPISTNDPWLADAAVDTNGNNVEAYVDLNAPDGFSNGDFRATTTGFRTFDRTYDVTQAPDVSVDQQMAAITQLFYTVNWLHDDFYDLGFDEAAGNAQVNNYGRGGAGGDAIRAEAQDYSGINNANMSTPADGLRPRMQMYLWSPTAGSLTLTLSGQLNTAVAPVGAATFGPTAFNITGPLVAPADAGGASTLDGCEALVGNQAGNVVLVNRGNCTFNVKAANAQAAGAIGVLIANNAATGAASPGGTDASITIPVVGITLAQGNDIRTALGGGAITASTTRVPGVAPDGDLDNTVVAHEWGHYISNRLVQNAAGLTNQVGAGMGEGWADFHGLLLIVKEGDDPDGVYGMAGYDLGGPVPAGQLNNAYYFGIRRYPYSTDLTKSPLLFRHIENGVALPVGPPVQPNGDPNSQVHNTGTVWASMLWECYAALLKDTPRLSFAEAQARMKRYVVAGYKMTPASPTFIEARDGLLAAALANDPQDFALCAAAFAKRGLGVGAVAPDRFNVGNAGVVESFDAGASLEVLDAELSDLPQYCDVDGVLDNGETGTLTLTARNAGFEPLASTTLTLASSDPRVVFPEGASVAMPASLPQEEFSASIAVGVSGVTGFDTVPIDITLADGSTIATAQIQTRVNADDSPQSSASDDVEARALSWTTRLEGFSEDSRRWSRRQSAADNHVLYGPDNDVAGVTWLESPDLVVGAGQSLTVDFQHRYGFEWDGGSNYDGGVIEISTDGGQTWSDLDPSVYTGVIITGGNNPLETRSAFVRDSAGYPAFVPVAIDTGATYSGQTVRIRFGVGSDIFIGAAGWEIDNVVIGGISNTPFASVVPHGAVCATLDATQGDPQATIVGTRFPASLKAQLRDPLGQPRVGETVRFSAPSSGASATFPGGLTTRDVTTNANGVAETDVFANATVGSYAVTASSGVINVGFALSNQAAVAGGAPTLVAASDSGVSNSDRLTNVAEPVFSGSCVDGDIVQLVEAGSNVGAPVVCNAGSYSASAALDEGVHTIAATFRRGITTSAPSAGVVVTIDRTPPAAPVITAVSGLSVTMRQISGTALVGVVDHSVSVEEGGVARCVSAVQAGGDWGCAATFVAGGVRDVVAVQIDAAGNRSVASAVTQVDVPAQLFVDGFEGLSDVE